MKDFFILLLLFATTERGASQNTSGCTPNECVSEQCVAVPNPAQKVSDKQCEVCLLSETTWWPCNLQNLCECYKNPCESCPNTSDTCEADSINIGENCAGCIGEDVPSYCNRPGVCKCCEEPYEEGYKNPCESCPNTSDTCEADSISIGENCAGCIGEDVPSYCNRPGVCKCCEEPYEEGWKLSDMFSEDAFTEFVGEVNEPYTYEGLVNAASIWNDNNPCKKFGNDINDITSFLGNTAHESGDFLYPREALMCSDYEVFDNKGYCKPCEDHNFVWGTQQCSSSKIANKVLLPVGTYGQYCNPEKTEEAENGCNCNDGVYETHGEGEDTRVIANDLFLGRGAIQLSWNYNYYDAGKYLTGDATTFCKSPDLVAKEGKYAWGAAFLFWMLRGPHEGATEIKDFGETLMKLNGALECGDNVDNSHKQSNKLRINKYCRAVHFLIPEPVNKDGKKLLPMSKCGGLTELYKECRQTGECPDCECIDREYTDCTSLFNCEWSGDSADSGFCTNLCENRTNKFECKLYKKCQWRSESCTSEIMPTQHPTTDFPTRSNIPSAVPSKSSIPLAGPCGDGEIGIGKCADSSLCCSQYGYCGDSKEHCENTVAPTQLPIPCGDGEVGNGKCADPSLCCSEYGDCGETEDHCRKNIKSPTPSPTRTNAPTLTNSGGSTCCLAGATCHVPRVLIILIFYHIL